MASRMAVLLAATLCVTLSVAAPCPAADEPGAKDAAAIVLKHVAPSYMMRLLGLVSADDAMADKPAAWYRTAADASEVKTSSPLPAGIDILVPFDPDKSLIAYGTTDAIEDLRQALALLDVPPKVVQVKAEFYRLTGDRAKQMRMVSKEDAESGEFELGLLGDPAGVIGSLRESKDASLIGAPLIAALNNQPARVSVTQQIPYEVTLHTITDEGRIAKEKKTQFISIDTSLNLLPRINADGTITLIVEAKAPAALPEPAQPACAGLLKTCVRVADGETVVVGGRSGDEEVLVLLITPKVVK